MNTFVTSDTHFGHRNIIKYCDRPFNSVTEMDNALIDNWNKKVRNGDRVFVLGDFTLSLNVSYINYLLNKLNGHKILIRGNHDSRKVLKSEKWALIRDVYNLRYKGYNFWLSHYAHRAWPRNCGFHLYGHSHGNIGEYPKSLDVGVDCWNFNVLNINDVIRHIRLRDYFNGQTKMEFN